MQGIHDTKIHAEKMCSMNFTKTKVKFYLSLHYNSDNSRNKRFRNCDLSSLFGKNTRLYGQVHEFSIDYDAIAKDNILDIYKYLMEKNGIV